MCLQWEKNSDLRFNLASSGLKRMKNFSMVHSWQKLVTGLYAPLVRFKILHSMLYGIFSSFISPQWLDSLVPGLCPSVPGL